MRPKEGCVRPGHAAKARASALRSRCACWGQRTRRGSRAKSEFRLCTRRNPKYIRSQSFKAARGQLGHQRSATRSCCAARHELVACACAVTPRHTRNWPIVQTYEEKKIRWIRRLISSEFARTRYRATSYLLCGVSLGSLHRRSSPMVRHYARFWTQPPRSLLTSLFDHQETKATICEAQNGRNSQFKIHLCRLVVKYPWFFFFFLVFDLLWKPGVFSPQTLRSVGLFWREGGRACVVWFLVSETMCTSRSLLCNICAIHTYKKNTEKWLWCAFLKREKLVFVCFFLQGVSISVHKMCTNWPSLCSQKTNQHRNTAPERDHSYTLIHACVYLLAMSLRRTNYTHKKIYL